jgi:hypothetical protein
MDQERINAQKGENSVGVCGHICHSAYKIIISSLEARVNGPTLQ